MSLVVPGIFTIKEPPGITSSDLARWPDPAPDADLDDDYNLLWWDGFGHPGEHDATITPPEGSPNRGPWRARW